MVMQMKEKNTGRLKLTQGKEAIVDAGFYDKLNEYKWHAKRVKCGNFYAVRRQRYQDGSRKIIYLHHLVAGFPLNGYVVDHISGDSLDNRKENLRIVTRRQNACNKKVVREGNKSSKYLGVTWVKNRKMWKAQIRIGNKQLFIGNFTNECDAFNAYKLEAQKWI